MNEYWREQLSCNHYNWICVGSDPIGKAHCEDCGYSGMLYEFINIDHQRVVEMLERLSDQIRA